MNGSRRLPTRLSIDSSVLIAYFLGEPTGSLTRQEILMNHDRTAYCSHLTLSETFYVLCRRRNRQFAMDALETLEKTGYLKLYESTQLDYAAGIHKCQRKISLADCYVLALAEKVQAAAAFAHREKDVTTELEENSPDVDVVFLEDFAKEKPEKA